METCEVSIANKFFDITKSIVEYEVRPGNTVTFMSEVDLTEVELLRARMRSAGRAKPSYTAVVAKALALALRDCPYANHRVVPTWFMVRLQRFRTCDVAVACERDEPGTEVATFVDVLREADRRSLESATEWLRKLASSDESNNTQWKMYRRTVLWLPRWLGALLVRLPVFCSKRWISWRGGAALISSPARYGVDAVLGSWPWPLGVSFGLVRQRAVVRDGKIVARPTFMFTLNFDRRVMAGAPAARFFHEIVRRLETADLEEVPSAGRQAATADAAAPVRQGAKP